MKLLTISQVSEMLAISKAIIYRLIADPRSRFPKPVKVGRSSRWRGADIERYIKSL